MLDGTLMLQVNLALVGIINTQSNKFVTGVMIKATGDSELNEGPDGHNKISCGCCALNALFCQM